MTFDRKFGWTETPEFGRLPSPWPWRLRLLAELAALMALVVVIDHYLGDLGEAAFMGAIWVASRVMRKREK